MPIHRMNLEGDVFVAKAVGYMENPDARIWANALRNHTEGSVIPIAALVDMIEVNRLCPTVTKIFGEVFKNPNMCAIAIVISDSMVSQNTRVINKLSEIAGVRVFPTYDEAWHFIEARLAAPVSAGNAWTGWHVTVPVYNFSFAGAF